MGKIILPIEWDEPRSFGDSSSQRAEGSSPPRRPHRDASDSRDVGLREFICAIGDRAGRSLPLDSSTAMGSSSRPSRTQPEPSSRANRDRRRHLDPSYPRDGLSSRRRSLELAPMFGAGWRRLLWSSAGVAVCELYDAAAGELVERLVQRTNVDASRHDRHRDPWLRRDLRLRFSKVSGRVTGRILCIGLSDSIGTTGAPRRSPSSCEHRTLNGAKDARSEDANQIYL